jgi:TetR/AcrR family transcriptional regulator
MRAVPPKMAEKLMAAATLFAERGLDGTKTEDIAAATGIPKATLYYYFEGKEQVLSFIFTVVLDAVQQAVTSATQAPGTAAERMRRLVAAHLRVFADYPEASQALHFDLGRAARLPEVAARSNNSFIEPVAALILEGSDEGCFRAVSNPRLAAVAILGAISTTAIHVIALEPEGDPAELIDVISEVVLDGILTEVHA